MRGRRRRTRPGDVTPKAIGYHPREVGRNIITSPGDKWFERDVLNGGAWHKWTTPLPPHLLTPAVAERCVAKAEYYAGLGQYGRAGRWYQRALRAAQ